MVPRADTVFIREDATADEAVQLIAEHGHSNYPILGHHPDDIVGILGVPELTRLPAARFDRTTAAEISRRPLLLPDTLPLPDAVRQMRECDDEFAVVLDEHGGVAGIVTYEDIAEELVGDIADESDQVVQVAVADGSGWLVDAQGRGLDARHLARPVPELAPGDTIAQAVDELRSRRATLAVVSDDSGGLVGLVSFDDLLAQLMEPSPA